ncbi:hypothetical protein, partial [Blastopirellula marina]
ALLSETAANAVRLMLGESAAPFSAHRRVPQKLSLDEAHGIGVDYTNCRFRGVFVNTRRQFGAF